MPDRQKIQRYVAGRQFEQGLDLGIIECADGHTPQAQRLGLKKHVLRGVADFHQRVAFPALLSIAHRNPLEHRAQHNRHRGGGQEHLAEGGAGQLSSQVSLEVMDQPVDRRIIAFNGLRGENVHLEWIERSRRWGSPPPVSVSPLCRPQALAESLRRQGLAGEFAARSSTVEDHRQSRTSLPLRLWKRKARGHPPLQGEGLLGPRKDSVARSPFRGIGAGAASPCSEQDLLSVPSTRGGSRASRREGWMIVGERVRLRAIERPDTPTLVRWLNDPEVRHTLLMFEPMSTAAEERWFERRLELEHDYLFSFEGRVEGRWIHLGNVGLHRVDCENRAARPGILLGEKEHWDKRFGTQAMRLMLDFAFRDLNLHRVELEAFAFNPRAIRCYEKAGFQREGALREAFFRDEGYQDIYRTAVLAPEFAAPRSN